MKVTLSNRAPICVEMILVSQNVNDQSGRKLITFKATISERVCEYLMACKEFTDHMVWTTRAGEPEVLQTKPQSWFRRLLSKLFYPFDVKQYVRVTLLITGTEWKDFFALDDKIFGVPYEIRALIRTIRSLLHYAEVRVCSPGEWHLPFVNNNSLTGLRYANLSSLGVVGLSAVRCAYMGFVNEKGEFLAEASLDYTIDIGAAHVAMARVKLGPSDILFVGWS